MRNEALRGACNPVEERLGHIGEPCVSPPAQLSTICEKNAGFALELHEMISEICRSILGADRNPCPTLEDSKYSIKAMATDTGIMLISMQKMLKELLEEVAG